MPSIYTVRWAEIKPIDAKHIYLRTVHDSTHEKHVIQSIIKDLILTGQGSNDNQLNMYMSYHVVKEDVKHVNNMFRSRNGTTRVTVDELALDEHRWKADDRHLIQLLKMADFHTFKIIVEFGYLPLMVPTCHFKIIAECGNGHTTFSDME